MSIRFSPPRLAAAVTLAYVAVVAACSQDAQNPIAPTVQLALIAGADHGGRPLSTEMTQEVTSVPVWAGDPDGIGSALVTLNHGQGEVCWEMSVANITLPATASHIHRAAPGIRGPIVVGLTAPDASGEAAGCASGVDRELIRDILVNPGSYYVNVHTSDFPPGAVRGQLPASR
jgi:hypothetical protein